MYEKTQLLIILLLAFACESSQQDQTVENSIFDEVPIGCTVQRVSETQWKQVCSSDADDHMMTDPLSNLMKDSSIDSDLGSDIRNDFEINHIDFARDEMDIGSHLEVDLGVDFELDTGIDFEVPQNQACDPPLQIYADTTATLPYQLLTIQASGGSGSWHFTFEDNQSQGIINETTGIYIAGDLTGVIDHIRVQDRECVGEASMAIEVVNPSSVTPQSPELLPHSRLTFQVEGGSGQYQLDFVQNHTEASITGLQYTAGALTGQDLLVLTDRATQESHTLSVFVHENVQIRPMIHTLYIPLHASIDVPIKGGSKVYQMEDHPAVIVEQVTQELDGQTLTLQAQQIGTHIVSIQDKFSPLNQTINIQVIPSLQAISQPHNDHQRNTHILSEHDLNHDGVKDFIVSESHADLSAHNGGGIFVYLSTVDDQGNIQYSTQAQQVLSANQRQDQMGRNFFIQDLDGDQNLEFVYGVSGLDLGETDSGAVYIHSILPEGSISEEAEIVFGGSQNDAQLGFHVAHCDFNGDGILDLVSTAYAYEDRTQDPIAWNQGGLFVYLGHEHGYFTTPDQIITGRWHEDGENWQHKNSFHLGYYMATGDFNGDQYCDLAVSSVSWTHQNQGRVLIYSGQAAGDYQLGGLSNTPQLWMSTDDLGYQSSQLGYRLVSKDIDQDGYDDLLMSQIGADYNQQTNTGIIYLYKGGSHVFDSLDFTTSNHEPLPMTVDDADLTLVGRTWDQMGGSLHLVEWEQKSYLLSTALYQDGPLGWDAGCILMYTLYDHTTQTWTDMNVETHTPYLRLCGPSQQFQLGSNAAMLGDLNQDGYPEFIVSSNRLGTEYDHVGRLFILSSDVERNTVDVVGVDEAWVFQINAEISQSTEVETIEVPYVMLPLEIPLQVAGIEFGTGVALVGDINDDGQEDALVTAPRATHLSGSSAEGSMWIYHQIHSIWQMITHADLDSDEIHIHLTGMLADLFPGHTSWDLLRYAHSAGDFNGDGYDDFVVLMGHDEFVNPLTDDWILPDGCTFNGWDLGGTYIFLGGPEFDWQPDFVYWGESGDQPHALSGGYDFNGDGYDDVFVGAMYHDEPDLNDAGSVVVIAGRRQQYASQIEVICQPAFEHVGRHVQDRLGNQVKGMRDLNGDGCDELVVGIQLDRSQNLINQGGALVIFGHGYPGCGYTAYAIKLNRSRAYEQMGASISVGDLTGDGYDDLALGAPYTYYDARTTGSAWVIPATFLQNQLPIRLDELNDDAGVWLSNIEADRWSIYGHIASGETGRNVQIIPASMDHISSLAVQTLNDTMAEQSKVSSIRFYRLNEDQVSLSAQPFALMGGESHRAGSWLGFNFALSRWHAPYMLVSAPRGNGVGLDAGSVYVLDLSILNVHEE